MKRFKLMPLVMTVLSGLYLVYVISSENTTLVADPYGGDPGGKVLPMVMGIFLFLGFLYITLTERPDGKHTDPATVRLFAVTLALSVLYTLLMKSIGFVILSVILLYALEYIYNTIGEERRCGEAVLGGVITLGVSCGVYLLFRWVTKTLMRLAREGVLPVAFKSSVTTGAISCAIVIAFTLLLGRFVCKPLKAKGHARVADAGLITFAAVLLLYIIFKQFFAVSMATGLLNY